MLDLRSLALVECTGKRSLAAVLGAAARAVARDQPGREVAAQEITEEVDARLVG